jgi:putative flippase GtrA
LATPKKNNHNHKGILKTHELLHLVKVQSNLFTDRMYKPFKGLIPYDTFRYGLCGGTNTALDIFLYFIFYNFILKKQLVHLGFITISPYIAAFLIVFPITFTTGFILAKYITFTQSTLRGRIQLMRYGITVLLSIFLNYVFLKILVETFHIYPTPSKLITTCFVVIFSYFSQKHFTFSHAK